MLYPRGMTDYMTVQEVAAKLGVSDEAVRKLIKRKRLPAEKVGSKYRGYWRIKAEDLESFERIRPGRPPKTGS